jgi:hypothetical protein
VLKVSRERAGGGKEGDGESITDTQEAFDPTVENQYHHTFIISCFSGTAHCW